MNEAHFGSRVRDRREELKWTQEDLEERTGISQSQVSKIESGAVGLPQRRTRQALARALGVSREWLEGVAEVPVDLGELSPEEASIVGAWRTADEEGRELLRQVARVVAGSASASVVPRAPAVETPQQAPGQASE